MIDDCLAQNTQIPHFFCFCSHKFNRINRFFVCVGGRGHCGKMGFCAGGGVGLKWSFFNSGRLKNT